MAAEEEANGGDRMMAKSCVLVDADDEEFPLMDDGLPPSPILRLLPLLTNEYYSSVTS